MIPAAWVLASVMLTRRCRGGDDMSPTGRILLSIVVAVLFLGIAALEVVSERVRVAPTHVGAAQPSESRTIALWSGPTGVAGVEP
jgi:hypothetical protein